MNCIEPKAIGIQIHHSPERYGVHIVQWPCSLWRLIAMLWAMSGIVCNEEWLTDCGERIRFHFVFVDGQLSGIGEIWNTVNFPGLAVCLQQLKIPKLSRP